MNPVRRILRLARESAFYFRSVWFLAVFRLRNRYVRTVVGLGWSLLHPITMVLTLSYVFTIIFPSKIGNYGVYLAAGLMPFTFLQICVTGMGGILPGRKPILDSTPMPPLVFVASEIVYEAMNFFIGFAALLALGFAFLIEPKLVHLFLPVAMAPIVIAGACLGTILAFVGPRYRDLSYLLGIFMSAAFWFVPIAYHWSAPPPAIAAFVQYNPITILISPIQVLVHGGVMPSMQLMIAAYAIALGLVPVAWKVYRALRRDIIFYL